VIRSGSHPARWSIPGVGDVHPCIDRVVITSPFSVGRLMVRLPKSDLERASHTFLVVTPSKNASLQTGSVVQLSGARSLAPLLLLRNYELELGSYSIVSAEIAYDVFAASEDAALKCLTTLIGTLSKRNHQRGFLHCEHKPYHTPPPGRISGPTHYFENRTSGVNLKCYVRHEKLAGGRFGQPIVRLEWTLRGKPALVRHLGGNQIGDLLRADLNDFFERNLRLERVDHLALGKLLRGCLLTANLTSKQVTRAKAFAYSNLRRLAHQEHARGRFPSLDHALKVCQFSPAQIRGYLRKLCGGKRLNRGRPKSKPKIQRRAITDHRINACFTSIKPRRVRPRIIIATLAKSPITSPRTSIT
jgi:hypothetical protein